MSNVHLLIPSIYDKTLRILNDFERCKEENGLLRTEIKMLKELINDKQKKIEVLEKEGVGKELVEGMNKLNKKKQAKQRINEMVREIDKCIALLNR